MNGTATGIALVMIVIALAAGEYDKRRRRAAFQDTYGSYEGFRKAVDAERVRAVRADRGDVAAVKAVRDDHPRASLRLATRYVREL
jgi:hypothetical protein